jgi:hypothetical protein
LDSLEEYLFYALMGKFNLMLYPYITLVPGNLGTYYIAPAGNFGDVVSEMDLNNLRQVEKVQLTRTSPGQAVECSQLCITQRVEL